MRRRSLIVWVLVAFAASDRAESAVTPAFWQSGSGAWSTAANWSTTPQVPQNGEPQPDSTYHAIFDTQNPAAYNVQISGRNVALDAISLRDNVTLQQSGGRAEVGRLGLESGRYVLSNNAIWTGEIVTADQGVFEVQSGVIQDSTLRGDVRLIGSVTSPAVLHNSDLQGATVYTLERAELSGQITGKGATIELNRRVVIEQPTTIGPGVTISVPPQTPNPSISTSDVLEILGRVETYETLGVGSRFQNHGQVTVLETGTFSQITRRADPSHSNHWTIHSGGQIMSLGRFELDEQSDVQWLLNGSLNRPLIFTSNFTADGQLRIDVSPSYMPRTDQSLVVIQANDTRLGEFDEIALGPLPKGFDWDISALNSEGIISFTGPATRRIAYTEFDEPPWDALDYTPAANGRELGFETTYEFNRGQFPAGGVIELLGERVLAFQSLDTSTVFDRVPIADFANVAVDLSFTVSETSFEDDIVELILHSEDAAQQSISTLVDLYSFNDLEPAVHELTLHVPSSWTEVSAEVRTTTNSSSAAEVVYLHSLDIVGYKYSARMERAGDFTVDGELSVDDLYKFDAILQQSNVVAEFDLDHSGRVDEGDRLFWIESLWGSYVGDSNLDGEFSSADLVAIFRAGQYEDGQVGNSRWESGDWNGDFEFNSSDLVLAFQRGGYEQGPRNAVSSVPEPSGQVLLLMSAGLLRGRHRVRSR